MIVLKSGLPLYHGSDIEVRNIDLRKCRKGKDFGKGFYTTTDKKQACDFARMVTKKNGTATRVLNKYILRDTNNLRIKIFEDVTPDWLECITLNRSYGCKNSKYSGYDIIVGKIADDNTSVVLRAYQSGLYGEVGSYIAVETAIRYLEPNKLNNQITFLTPKALLKLKFEGSEIV